MNQKRSASSGAPDISPPGAEQERTPATRLTVADWEKINASLISLYQELDMEQHARTMLRVINELVPADSLCLNIFASADNWKVISLPENFVTEEQLAVGKKFAHQSPFGSYYLATRDASWKMLTDFMPIEDFQKLEFYRFACAPLGINQLLGGMLASVDGSAHILIIHRKIQEFTEREREILNVLHPHLVTSHLHAVLLNRANHSVGELQAVLETAPGAYGYFAATGQLVWMQPRAQAWLLEFFPGETRTTSNVPRSIMALIQASQADAGTPRSLIQASATEFLTVMLSKSALRGWILRLERKPKVQKVLFHPLAQLSPRENEVLRWMVQGKRNAEIAAILKTSPRTVEKHVHAILTKFAVENRASAILRAMELYAAMSMSSA